MIFLVLLKIVRALNISKDETRDFLERELLITRERENLVCSLLVHNDEHIRLAPSNYLLGFAE